MGGLARPFSRRSPSGHRGPALGKASPPSWLTPASQSPAHKDPLVGCCSSHLTDGETEAPRGGGLDLVPRPQSERWSWSQTPVSLTAVSGQAARRGAPLHSQHQPLQGQPGAVSPHRRPFPKRQGSPMERRGAGFMGCLAAAFPLHGVCQGHQPGTHPTPGDGETGGRGLIFFSSLEHLPNLSPEPTFLV